MRRGAAGLILAGVCPRTAEHGGKRNMAGLAVALAVATQFEADAVGRELRAECADVAGGALLPGLAGVAWQGVRRQRERAEQQRERRDPSGFEGGRVAPAIGF